MKKTASSQNPLFFFFSPLKNVPTAERQSDLSWASKHAKPQSKLRRHIPGSAKSNTPPTHLIIHPHPLLLKFFHFDRTPLSLPRLAPTSSRDSFLLCLQHLSRFVSFSAFCYMDIAQVRVIKLRNSILKCVDLCRVQLFVSSLLTTYIIFFIWLLSNCYEYCSFLKTSFYFSFFFQLLELGQVSFLQKLSNKLSTCRPFGEIVLGQEPTFAAP